MLADRLPGAVCRKELVPTIELAQLLDKLGVGVDRWQQHHLKGAQDGNERSVL